MIQLLKYEIKYIIFIVFSLTFYFILSKGKRKSNLIATIVMSILFTYISSIRVNYGSDYYSYYISYNSGGYDYINFSQLNFQNLQLGFPVLAQLAKNISNSPYSIFFVVSTIVFPGYFIWAYRKSNDVYLSLLIFLMLGFFDINNNILKQAISMIVMLWAYEWKLEGRKILSLIFFLISVLFHYSAIVIYFIIILSRKLYVNKKRFNFIMIFTLIPLTMYDYVLPFVFKYVSFLGKYENYLDSKTSSVPFILTSLLYLMLLTYFYFKLLNVKKLEKNDIYRLNVIALSLPFVILSFRYIGLLRLSLFAVYQLIILVPKYLSLFNIKKKTINLNFVILIIFFIITIISSGNNRYYDYSTIYDDEPSIIWYR